MKIVKLNSLCPSYMVEPTYMAFIRELELLSQKYGIAVTLATSSGFVMFDPERDRVKYQRDPCSDNLEPVISAK